MKFAGVIVCFVAAIATQVSGQQMMGDMVLTPEQVEYINSGGMSRATVNRQWANNLVPYVIDGSANDARGVIQGAMNEWSRKTCIRFKVRSNERNFIRFFAGQGCWSNVGSVGGEQRISLQARGCWHHGIVVHEIGHALGFWHEQNRPDRDNFVTIHFNNIQDGKSSQFFKLGSSATNTPYDYGSIMHYGEKDFSKNGKATITKKKNGPGIGQRNGLSEMDTQEAQILYKCPAGGPSFDRLICESSTQEIRCHGGRRIRITYANYGRRNMLKCQFVFWASCSSNQTRKLGSICNGKTSCRVSATNRVFGDPCSLIRKYLDVSYRCDP